MIGDPSGKSTERTMLTRDDDRREHRGHARAARALPRLRGPQRRAARRQPRLARRAQRDRVPARHRQALLRERDDPARLGAAAARRPRPGHLVHRVHVRAAAGLRLPRALRPLRLPAADGRQRPVGQHPRRLRADPPAAPGRGATASRCRSSRRPTAASSASPSRATSGSTPRRTSPFAFYQFWLNADDADVVRYLRFFTFLDARGDRGARGAARRAPRAARGAARARRAASPRWCTARRRARERAAHDRACCSRAATCASWARANSTTGLERSAAHERPARASSRLAALDLPGALVRCGLAPSKGQARTFIQQGAVSVNDEVVREEASARSASPTCSPDASSCCAAARRRTACSTWPD